MTVLVRGAQSTKDRPNDLSNSLRPHLVGIQKWPTESQGPLKGLMATSQQSKSTEMYDDCNQNNIMRFETLIQLPQQFGKNWLFFQKNTAPSLPSFHRWPFYDLRATIPTRTNRPSGVSCFTNVGNPFVQSKDL